MTARVKIVERSGLWPSVELSGASCGFQQTFLCPLLASVGDSDEAGESRAEESDIEDEDDEERQDINVDDE